MQRVVGDILDLARFRAGDIRLQLRRFEADELAASAAASLLPLSGELGIAVIVVVDGAPAPVYGDHRRLEQALVNLVANALRFSPHDMTVTVSVVAHAGWTRWVVTDRGPGIPPEHRARLFERFFVDQADRRGTQEGTGLGLPTALAIAQAHGGAIEVDSEPGHGSTFTLAVRTDGPEETTE